MIPSTRTADEMARERVRHSLDESLLVEAAAGTGKTTEMVRRIVNVLRRGTKIQQIVAVTFTNKAAGEMKLRLRQELDRLRGERQSDEERAHLEHALAHLEEGVIGTIHSFCAMILHERPVEACVDPAFEEMDEAAQRRLFNNVFQKWFQEKLNQDAPALRRALARLAAGADRDPEYTPMDSLRRAAYSLLEWRDFPAPWTRPDLEREYVLDQLAETARGLSPNGPWHYEVRDAIHDLLPWLDRKPRDYDMLEGLFFKLHRVSKRKGEFPDPKLWKAIDGCRPYVEMDLAARLRDELWELIGRYTEAKRVAGKLDFRDLLERARDLIRDNESVRRDYQRKYTHLFVDEFQDTDPLQCELLLLLAAGDPSESDWRKARPKDGKLFVVGDPKQSIYKFRRADLLLYQELRDRLASQGVGVVHLSRSFRSVPGIQRCVNHAFEPLMNGDRRTGQADWVPLGEYRSAIPGQPAVVALPAPQPYGKRGGVAKWAVDECLPGTTAAFIDWLLHASGWKVSDPEHPDRRPAGIRPGHICLLFRRFLNGERDVGWDYVRELEDRGIPHLRVGSKTFHWREEVNTLRAALTAIEWPDDELAVFAALKGTLFAIPDHVLLRFRHEFNSLHPFRDYPEDVPEPCRSVLQALRLLGTLHRSRNRRPFAETVYQLLEMPRAWAAFAMRPAGEQVLANARRVVELARQFEMNGGLSFRSFVEELNAQAERAESTDAPMLEEGAEGVRLMSVHSAKGLEFPVVILADLTCRLSREKPERHVDSAKGLSACELIRCTPAELRENTNLEKEREAAEAVRLAYVAATRARDLLVVTAVREEPIDGWLSPLYPSIYPPDSANGVYWCDPKALPAARPLDYSKKQYAMLRDDDAGRARSMTAHEAWQTARKERLSTAIQPEVRVLTPAEAEQPPEWRGTVEFAEAARQPARPKGKRFGTLVHDTLRDVPLDASAAQVLAVVRLHARLLAAPGEEADAAAVAVRHALAHPLLTAARSAERVHREYPLTWRTPSGEVMEGLVDLAYRSGASWVVVDFKSDADAAELLERYRVQVSWYAAALEAIDGAPVRAFVLAV